MSKFVFINGHILPKEKAFLNPADRGFLYGDGLFETMCVKRGKVFYLLEHLNRIREGSRRVGFKIPIQKYLVDNIKKIILKNKLIDGSLKIIITRGVGGKRLSVPQNQKVTLIISCEDMPGVGLQFGVKEIKLILLKTFRNSTSLLSRIKSLNYLEAILGKQEVKNKKADEGLFLNEKGNVTCVTAGNIYFLKEKLLITPPAEAGILEGITRHIILNEIAPGLKIKVREQNISYKKLIQFDGAFISNSLIGIIKVRQIGGVRFKGNVLIETIAAEYKTLLNSI